MNAADYQRERKPPPSANSKPIPMNKIEKSRIRSNQLRSIRNADANLSAQKLSDASRNPPATAKATPGHSPLPWAVRYDEHDEELLIENDSFTVARVGECSGVPAPEDIANAAYIIQACNAYPDLLAALDDVESITPDDNGNREVTPETMKVIRAALAKAQGGGK